MDDLEIRSNEAPTGPTPHGKALTWEPDVLGKTELSFRLVEPAALSVEGLNVQIDIAPSAWNTVKARFTKGIDAHPRQKSRRKTILSDITAHMPSGTLTAIIGASGSGKTSFLDAISHRARGRQFKTSGSIRYNGNTDILSIRSAYVAQEDVLSPTLTVRATLQYAADLRLPLSMTAAERRQIVDEVILELGLKECASTRIGNEIRKGCSGGEKRRTSLGVQMLANPSVLFLDEVTTGLDATSALQLVRTLKYLTIKGRTIITTIHQPRSEIWGFFDRLVLLSEGCSIYAGPANASIDHFERLGHKLPSFMNPAEYLIDLTAVDTRRPDLETASRARVQSLKSAWQPSLPLPEALDICVAKEQLASAPTHADAVQRPGSRFAREVRVQTARTFKTTLRDPMGIAGSFTEAVSLGIIAGWIFIKLDGTLSGIRSRQGTLHIAASLQGYIILLYEIYRLTLDITLFHREKSEGVVGTLSFLISRRLARLVIEDVTVSLLFSVIFYFFIGFRSLASQFFIFYVIVLLCQFISVTFATFCVALFGDFTRASLLANLTFTFQSICSGVLIQSNQIPIYVRWIKYIAYVWYANGAFVYNEFLAHTSNPAGQLYDCREPAGFEDPRCKPYTGQYIVETLGFPFASLWTPIMVLAGFALFFFFGSAVLLKCRPIELSVSRERSNGKDQEATYSPIGPWPHRDRAVDVSLENYSLDIQNRSLPGRKSTKVSILKPINMKFEPGKLNVIMGPSGSGKTSLLNMMALRFYNGIGTRYESGGNMLFRGAVPSESVVRSLVSYVSQDDDALISALTVRETLRFAAELRLPKWMSREEKIERADAVLLRLNLRDCADSSIGDDYKKGISKGEKRRVTIGVEILTDPQILILDEPTSGLDAFTAISIIDVIQSLAEENKTLILSIHQPRSDMFTRFDHILLLARGGQPVYAGKCELMLRHFSDLGYQCPVSTNPADFALDLITIDLQHSVKEAISRDRVRSLVSRWEEKTRSEKQSPPERTIAHVALPAEFGSLKRVMTPLRVALPILLRRSSIGLRRNPGTFDARIAQVLGFAIILTLFWAPLKSNYEGVQSRVGFIQQQMGLYFVGMLQNVALYPHERNLFYREHDDRAYPVEAFFLQYLIFEIPFEIVSSLLFAIFVVLAVGLPRNASMFFIEALNCFCLISCGESIGIMFNTLFNHSDFAVNVTAVIISIALVMAGVLSVKLPPFLHALNHLSPTKWSVGNLAPYTLQGQTFTCNDSQRLSNDTCPITTGQQVLELYNLDVNPAMNLAALVICATAYRLAAYLLLRTVRTSWKELFF